MFAPTTKVYILRNAPVDPALNNFINFSNAEDDANYFLSLKKYYWPSCKCEGTETNEGYIKLPGTPQDYYDCNYIMWQNSQFTNKWFYAFLDSVKPYSGDVCVGHYSIDYMHTWFYETQLGYSFIAREHVNDDTIGRWVEDEPVPINRFLNPRQTDLLKLNEIDDTKYLIVYYTFSPDNVKEGVTTLTINNDTDDPVYKIEGMKPYFTGGYFYNGLYQGAQFLAFRVQNDTINEDCEKINNFLTKLVQSGVVQKIINIRNVPGFIASHATAIPVNTYNPIKESLQGNPRPTNLDGYIPKNKKMFTSQFCRGFISNGAGSSVEFEYEDFDGGIPTFSLYAQLASDVTARLVFNNYKGLDENFNECIDIGNYPESSFSYSEYSNSFMAGKFSNAEAITWGKVDNILTVEKAKMGTAGTIGDAAMSAPTSPSGITGLLSGLVDSAKTLLFGEREYEGKVMAGLSDGLARPNTMQGNANSNIAWATNTLTFMQYDIVPQYYSAQRADDYLSRYGYNVSKNGIPHVNGRKCWNYLEIPKAYIIGSIPAEAKIAMMQIYQSGVTFWHSPEFYMNYSLDNPIVGGDPD